MEELFKLKRFEIHLQEWRIV